MDNALIWVTVNVFRTNGGPSVGSIIFALDKAAMLNPATNTVRFSIFDPSALGGTLIQPAITQVSPALHFKTILALSASFSATNKDLMQSYLQ